MKPKLSETKLLKSTKAPLLCGLKIKIPKKILMSFVKKYCKMQKNVLDKSRFILNTIWYKNYNDVETLPVKRTVKDAIELLRNCDLGQMVRYAATIWQTKFGALFRFAFLRASQLQFIFQQCLNKPLWTRLAEGEYLVQITFHCIYTKNGI